MTAHKIGTALLEREFQAQVIAYARLHGWRVYSIPDSRRSTENGYPDLTLWKPGGSGHPEHGLFWAELKREKGKLRPQQEIVIDELRQLGHIVYVWRPSDWDTIEEVLK